VDASLGRRGRDGVEDGIERVVVDRDQLGCVLGEVAVARHDDGQRLADVARGADGSGVEGHWRVDTGRKGTRHRSDVVAGEHSHDAWELERGRGIERNPCVCELRADDRSVTGVRSRHEVVHEAPRAAQQRLVLDPQDRPSDPRSGPGRHAHADNPTGARSISALGPPLRMAFRGTGDLLVARAAGAQRPKGLENGASATAVALRRERERLTNGASAVRAREVDLRHQSGRVPLREHAQQLEDRRRAANLVADFVVWRDAGRREPGNAL
jgi:hypothetical protein